MTEWSIICHDCGEVVAADYDEHIDAVYDSADHAAENGHHSTVVRADDAQAELREAENE